MPTSKVRSLPVGGVMQAIDALLDDYFDVDLWPVLSLGTRFDTQVIIGEKSNVFADEDRSTPELAFVMADEVRREDEAGGDGPDRQQDQRHQHHRRALVRM